MSGITHHIPESLLIAYASGTLPYPFALVVATHVSMCEECRVSLGAHEAVGGLVVESLEPVRVSDTLRQNVMGRLDEQVQPVKRFMRSGIYPAPVMEALSGKAPKWKSLGLGSRQAILDHGSEGSVRLLYIPEGQAVPDHGHNGLELTLVLQGSFSDETGRYGVGDLEVADCDLDHMPVADPGQDCICLAATDAPLRFSSFIPRILQPVFRI